MILKGKFNKTPPKELKFLNPISPGLFGGLITRGGGTKYPPPDISEILIALKLKLWQSDTQSMLTKWC